MPRILLTVLLAFLTLLPLQAAGIRQKKIKKVPYCNLYDLLTLNKFKVSRQTQRAVAYGRGLVCEFPRNQRRMVCNQIKVELLNNISTEGTMPWLSTLDWYKTLRPILYPATVPRKKITRIMIDMGHGGNDPGAIGKISREKNITLKVGLRVAQILRSYGYQVSMTRTGDVQIPLNKIGPMQQKSGSDLFVSIHVNSAKDRKISGVETYCLSPAGSASSNGGKVTSTAFRGNAQDAGNMLLAWQIQRALLKRTKAADRGIKRARFAVLKDLNAPGVLVEIGFISNTAEERLLNDPKYIDKIAYGIVDGIVAFGRSTKPRR